MSANGGQRKISTAMRNDALLCRWRSCTRLSTKTACSCTRCTRPRRKCTWYRFPPPSLFPYIFLFLSDFFRHNDTVMERQVLEILAGGELFDRIVSKGSYSGAADHSRSSAYPSLPSLPCPHCRAITALPSLHCPHCLALPAFLSLPSSHCLALTQKRKRPC